MEDSVVLSGSLPSLWPASSFLGCLLCLDFGPCPLVSFSLPCLGAFFLWSLVGFHRVHCLDLGKVKWSLLLGVLLLGVFTFNTNFHPFFIKKYPPSFFFSFLLSYDTKKKPCGSSLCQVMPLAWMGVFSEEMPSPLPGACQCWADLCFCQRIAAGSG